MHVPGCRLSPATILLGLVVMNPGAAQAATASELAPREYEYRRVGDQSLKLAVFAAPAPAGKLRPAVAVFHGGGWTMGRIQWTFGDARSFAAQGYVGIGVQYRLANRADVTPIEAVADAREALRWIRRHAAELGVDPRRVVALGWSAGAHLAAMTAALVDPLAELDARAVPDALVLWYPPMDLELDDWIPQLLQNRADRRQLSPDQYVRPGWPPTLVLIGRLDKITPAAGSEKFQRLMLAAGNRCELHVYEGVGHSFEDAPGHIDPAVLADSKQRSFDFLRRIGIANP
jgi:acetyl esterase